jgi:pantoate--beta-alanine ligase
MQVLFRLIKQVEPSVLILGKKDYQQFLVVKEMVQELDLSVKVFGGEIVREANGLAMSSRNNYFAPEIRAKLGIIYETLTQVRDGKIDIKSAQESLIQFGFDKIDYLEVRSSDTLKKLDKIDESGRIFFAGHYRSVRLIDNLELNNSLLWGKLLE